MNIFYPWHYEMYSFLIGIKKYKSNKFINIKNSCQIYNIYKPQSLRCNMYLYHVGGNN